MGSTGVACYTGIFGSTGLVSSMGLVGSMEVVGSLEVVGSIVVVGSTGDSVGSARSIVGSTSGRTSKLGFIVVESSFLASLAAKLGSIEAMGSKIEVDHADTNSGFVCFLLVVFTIK